MRSKCLTEARFPGRRNHNLRRRLAQGHQELDISMSSIAELQSTQVMLRRFHSCLCRLLGKASSAPHGALQGAQLRCR